MRSLPEAFYQIKDSKNILNFEFGKGSLKLLEKNLLKKRTPSSFGVFLIDEFFENKNFFTLPVRENDLVIYVPTRDEPSTDLVDEITARVQKKSDLPTFLVGIGGGITLDMTKAVSNLLTNDGRAEDYQGWDLVQKPGVFKIGIPTLSGTGAEASRTCVLMNYKKNLKLGMNSEHTVFDRLILDPDLTQSVPREQYFYTGMDTYIHCVESLNGQYRNAIGDEI